MPAGLLIRRAEVDGNAPLDVRCRDGRIAEIGARLAPLAGEDAYDAAGGALLPGLHDHHIHLFALAASARSVPCGPPGVSDAAALGIALRAHAPNDQWVRGVGYHESVAGDLDRGAIDRLISDRPTRIQHRSGAAWLVNSAAIAWLGIDQGVNLPGIERDRDGRATGRLFRMDAWLRDAIDERPQPDFRAIGTRLSAYGVIGVTDATADNDCASAAAFADALVRGELNQHVVVMGTQALAVPRHASLSRGARKIVLDERELPTFDELCEAIRSAHENDRNVAVHCVTRAELVVAVAAFAAAGSTRGDRIEHAAVAAPETLASLQALPLTVVTQPTFLRERGDLYRKEVEARDLPWLYRCRGLLDLGIPLAGGTDAPYASADPWLAMRSAVDRATASGASWQPDERLSPEQALALFTSRWDDPGRCQRMVAHAQAADLCVLDRPWSQARDRLDADDVAATVRAGRIVHRRGANVG